MSRRGILLLDRRSLLLRIRNETLLEVLLAGAALHQDIDAPRFKRSAQSKASRKGIEKDPPPGFKRGPGPCRAEPVAPALEGCGDDLAPPSASNEAEADLLGTPPRRAWRDRFRILSPLGRPTLACRFLELTKGKVREAYTVCEAAWDMGMGRSTLERLSLMWFSFSPGTIIDLARVLSVARDLQGTDEALKAVAANHKYSSHPAMGRTFLSFVGVSPGFYRALSRLAR